jgi:peroxiredoxin Q/BCP|tara:strand:+ start:365 stop:496 length:132 start_codon:yes stop_codon:yes gene_type:complete
MLKEGVKAPSFTLENQDGKSISLSDFDGQKVLLWFYPKASTPG